MISTKFLLPENFEHIKAFRAWLPEWAPGWSISGADVEKTTGGSFYLVFSLLRNGLPIAVCDSAEDALSHIGDPDLIFAYATSNLTNSLKASP